MEKSGDAGACSCERGGGRVETVRTLVEAGETGGGEMVKRSSVQQLQVQ